MSNKISALTNLSSDLADSVELAGKSVVMVNSRRRVAGSGLVYGSDLILTADHVIEQEDGIRILTYEGQQGTANLVGRDPVRDLALLRLSDLKLQPAAQSQEKLRVGMLAFALGRPDDGGIQASLGIISAISGPVRVGRMGMLEGVIRTDAIPYPGFSGGPLVNLQGEVIGLNTSGLAMGTLLTIPASIAWEAASTLESHGHIRRGYLGVRSQTVTLAETHTRLLGRTQETGLLIVGIEKDSPAERAGLQVGDILVGVSGQPLLDHDELQVYLGSESVDQLQPFEVLRGDQKRIVQVKISERSS